MQTLKVYVLKRLLQSIPLVLFVMAINFLIIHAAPGDPITYLYGSSAEVSAEQMHSLREQLGLTQPLSIQFFLYQSQTCPRVDLGADPSHRGADERRVRILRGCRGTLGGGLGGKGADPH